MIIVANNESRLLEVINALAVNPSYRNVVSVLASTATNGCVVSVRLEFDSSTNVIDQDGLFIEAQEWPVMIWASSEQALILSDDALKTIYNGIVELKVNSKVRGFNPQFVGNTIKELIGVILKYRK
ncbi:hypothetical protein FWF48_02655 [Candidatus Saccharibacteria bacterium]|nr:hypothetical protein [Candidatus Saccharibacteria bacterium]